MEVIIDGKRMKISLFELMMRKLYLLGGQGNFKAIKMALEVREIALRSNARANIQLHKIVEEREIDALMKGHYPPTHEVFKRLNYWRKRTQRI
jgi:hypothetical protein